MDPYGYNPFGYNSQIDSCGTFNLLASSFNMNNTFDESCYTLFLFFTTSTNIIQILSVFIQR